MKKYKAKFWRGNPQLTNGGYVTERVIEARDIRSANKKARDYNKCVYGTMELLEIEEIKA